MIELANEEGDLDLLPECQESVKAVKKEIEAQTLATLLSGEFDSKNAILTFMRVQGARRRRIGQEMLFRHV